MDLHDPRNDSGVRSLDGAKSLHKTPALNPRSDLATYISGYVDGEGCFCVSFQPSRRHRFGWEVRPSFSVSQKCRTVRAAHDAQEHVGLRLDPTGSFRQDVQVRGSKAGRPHVEGSSTFELTRCSHPNITMWCSSTRSVAGWRRGGISSEAALFGSSESRWR